MPLFKINAVDVKSNDWKIVSLTSQEGVTIGNVSVNRVNKKNETFPAFDDIVAGKEVEGNLWTSQAGKNYLFAPEVKTYTSFQKGGGKSAVIEKAQDRKESSIERFQNTKEESISKTLDRKEDSFMISGTARDATLILTALVAKSGFTLEANDWQEQWLKIRHFLVKQYHNTEPSKVGNTDIIYPENLNEDTPF